MSSNRTAVCVFAKPPRVGASKTRLAELVGAERAAMLAEAFLVDTWALVRALEWATPVLATTDATGLPALPDLRSIWLQGDGDLGRRIERILRRALRTHGAGIAIGADSPATPRERLDSAHRALCGKDAVIGPTTDGGFDLLALRRCPRGLLADVPWSSPETFARTLGRISGAGLDVAVLDPWFDVDRPPDLVRLHRLLGRAPARAPVTARMLESMVDVLEPR